MVARRQRLALCLVATGCCALLPTQSSAQYIKPNNPPQYLSQMRLVFDDYHRRNGSYPVYWYDIQNNCRVKRAPLCQIEEKLPRSERITMKPQFSKYSYKIAMSSRNHFRIVAIKEDRCPEWYIDEVGPPMRIATSRRRAGC